MNGSNTAGPVGDSEWTGVEMARRRIGGWTMTQATGARGARSSRARVTAQAGEPGLGPVGASAVLLVVLGNAGLLPAGAGSVGVHVLLVLAGFLITRPLVAELRASGTFRALRSVVCSVRRLLPATLVVLVVTAVLARLTFPRTQWVEAAVEIMWGAVQATNWYLALQGEQPGLSHAGLVEHLWPVAVVVQFAVTWPIVLRLVAVAVRPRRRGSPAPVLVGAALLGLPSLAWWAAGPETGLLVDPMATTTRMWEPVLGAVLATVTHRAWHPRGPERIAGPVSAAGPVRAAGRRAFAFYLCHWPLLVIGTTVLGELDVATGLVLLAAIALLTEAVHRFVERPIRRAHAQHPRPAQALAAAGMAVVVAVASGVALALAAWPPAPPAPPAVVVELAAADPVTAPGPDWALGAAVLGPQAYGDPQGVPTDQSASITPAPDAARADTTDCTQDIGSAVLRSCTFGDAQSSTTVAVVGDGHAAQWIPGLAEVAIQRGWGLVAFTKQDCPFADVATALDGREYRTCRRWHDAVRDHLLTQIRPALVVTSNGPDVELWQDGQASTGPDAEEALVQGLRRDYAQLTAAGTAVAVLSGTPDPAFDVAACVLENPIGMTRCAGSREVMLSGIGDEQVAAADDVADVRVLDLNDAICPAERCAPVIGSVLVYRDDSLLTATYVRSLAPRLVDAFAAFPT